MRDRDWRRRGIKGDIVKKQHFLHKRRIKRQKKYSGEDGRGTVVFIDGASLYHHMGENLGIGAFRMPQLYRIFAKGLAMGSWIKIYFVIPFCKLWQMIEEVEDARFIPILVAMDRPENDDRFIIEEIQDIDADSVRRIILVSTDGGFAPHLKQKEQEGIEIIIVATRALDADTGNHALSRSLCELFSFIELENYQSCIMGKVWMGENRIL